MTVNIIEHATDASDWYDSNGDLNTTGVASLPLTVLTLARAREELRVPPGDTGQDGHIRNLIDASVAYVQEDLNIPVTSEQVYVVLRNGRIDAPLTFNTPGDPFVMSASKVRHQLQSVEMYTPGDWPEVIDIVADNQIAPGIRDGDEIAGNIIVKPPDGRWPLAAANHYALFYTRGIKDSYASLNVIRQLVVLKLRDMFYGSPVMKGQENSTAYERLAKIIRYLGTTHPINRIA